MSFSVADFKAQLEFGGARPNLFEFRLTFPSAVALGGAAGNKITFMAKAASLPASNVESISVPYFGRDIKVKGDRTFEDYTVTVINDEDFIIRNALEQWSNIMNAHEANVALSARPETYSVDAEVIQYGQAGNEIKRYRFIGLFPKNVGEIAVAWDSNNAVEEFPCTFAYSWWEAITTS